MKTKKRIIFLVALMTIGLWGFWLPLQAQAAIKTWDRGASTDNWSDGDNWNSNGVPVGGTGTTGDGVTIGSSSMSSNYNVNYNYTYSSYLNSLTITGKTSGTNRNATLNLQSGTLLTNSLVLSNSRSYFNLSGATLTTTNAINLTAGTFSQTSGTLDANFTQNGGKVGNDSTTVLDIQNGKTFIYNSGTFSGRLKLNNGSTGTFNADFTAGNGMANYTTLTFGSTRTLDLNGAGLDNQGTITAQGGTLTLDASGGTGGVTNNGTFKVASGATMIIVPASIGNLEDTFKNYNVSTSTLTGGTYEVAGTLQLPLQTSPDMHYIYTNNATIILDGPNSLIRRNAGATNVLSDLQTNDTLGTLTLKNSKAFQTTAAFTNKGTVNVESSSSFTAINGTTLQNYTQNTAGALTNLNGGSLSASTITLSNGSFTKTGGTLKVTTAFNQSGGTSTFDTLSIDDGASNVKAYNLTGGFLTAGTVALTNGSFSKNQPSGTGTLKVTTAFNQSGGTSTFDILSIDDGASYIKAYNLSGTGILNAPIINLTGGTFKKTGGTLNYTTFNQDGGTSDFTPGNLLINSTYNLAGGELKAAKTINSSGSAFNYSGGIMNSGLENAGVATLSGTGNRTVNGAVTNEGTFNVNAPATATFNGDFTNKGAYISSASSNTFLQNLTITSLGYLQAGIGNLFQIGGNFVNQSTQNTLWNTAEANLAFYNSGSHSLFLAGADFGKAWNGTMETGYFNNFSWGSFNIGSGATVALYDGNTGNTGSALYVGLISGLVFSGDHKSITNISGQSGLNIYYDARLADNSYLEGKIYALAGGGELRPVPLPSAVWLLGAGLIGLVGVRRRFVR